MEHVDKLPSEADRVLIAVNPHAGGGSVGDRVERLQQTLGRLGLTVEVCTSLEEVCSRANQWHVEGRLRALVGAGGDGTAAELVNRTHPGVPLAILPAGTANLLARHWALPHQTERLAEIIKLGQVVRLDAGRAAGRIFLLMIGCGFDAEVVRHVHAYRQSSRRGGHINYLSYLKPILQAIRSYSYPEIRIYWDEACEITEGASPLVARWVFVCNLPRYGWGLPLAPKAVATDGLLDLCAFARGSLWRGLGYVASAQFGWHESLADCVVRRARRFRLTADEPVAYQMDGDPGGFLPLEVEVLPGRLTLIVPPGRES